MNKKQIISKIIDDLPTRDMRGEMTKEEWYGWFEECWDKAINYIRCCKSDSEQLFAVLRYAMPDQFTDIALKNIVKGFEEKSK